jgi:SAM-dependent methyltransferase
MLGLTKLWQRIGNLQTANKTAAFGDDQPRAPDPMDPELKFRNNWYHRHNLRRQEHLASLRLDLEGKSVLEVGAGVGDHTTFFLDRNCRVTSLEARPENCALFARTMDALKESGYEPAARWNLIEGDIESLDRMAAEKYDIVYCYGLLYHLQDPARAIEVMAARCGDLLLLETCVSVGDGEAVNPVEENAGDPTQSFRGGACRPTRLWVFNRLKGFFDHIYVPLTQPAHVEFPLDWSLALPPGRLTRAVFVASRKPIKNEILVDFLPARQEIDGALIKAQARS